MPLTTLNIDMDGVVADLDSAYHKAFGFPTPAFGGPEFDWDSVYAKEDFFSTMPETPWAVTLIEQALLWKAQHPKRHVRILTAATMTNFKHTVSQKRIWWSNFCERNAHLLDVHSIHLVPCPGSNTKHLYLDRPGDVLVDDFDKNIARWRNVGGHAIHIEPQTAHEVSQQLIQLIRT